MASSKADIPATELTLIGRIADKDDDVAWRRFIDRYGSVLRRWCLRWGLPDSDVDDVVQNILFELSRHIRSYSPSGRFRGWLKTVARRAWYDFSQRRQKLDRASGGTEIHSLLQSVAAQDEFLSTLEAEAEAELVEIASAAVQARVSEKTWQAFRLLTLEELSGDEVAEALGMQTGSVYVASCRVKKMLQEEVRHLSGEDT